MTYHRHLRRKCGHIVFIKRRQPCDCSQMSNKMFHEEAIGDYTFMCKVTDDNGTVESKATTLTIRAGN